jgi:hypothetical protein
MRGARGTDRTLCREPNIFISSSAQEGTFLDRAAFMGARCRRLPRSRDRRRLPRRRAWHRPHRRNRRRLPWRRYCCSTRWRLRRWSWSRSRLRRAIDPDRAISLHWPTLRQSRVFPRPSVRVLSRRRFIAPFFGAGLFAAGYGYSSCWSWVPTAFGWQEVWVCGGPYGYGYGGYY